MRTTIFCTIFLVFSFLYSKYDVHPTNNLIVPQNWGDYYADDPYLPSRCGGIDIKSASPKYYKKFVCVDSFIFYLGSTYGCHIFDDDKNYNLPNHKFDKKNYPQNSFFYSEQIIDLNTFDSGKSFENNLFKSIGYNFENIVVNTQNSCYINGNICIKYEITSNSVSSKFYFFKRRKYALLHSAWSEDKIVFNQKIPIVDSIVNTFRLN